MRDTLLVRDLILKLGTMKLEICACNRTCTHTHIFLPSSNLLGGVLADVKEFPTNVVEAVVYILLTGLQHAKQSGGDVLSNYLVVIKER